MIDAHACYAAEQKATAAHYEKWEADLTTREHKVAARRLLVEARERAADERMAEAEAKIGALRAALDVAANLSEAAMTEIQGALAAAAAKEDAA